MSAEGRARRQSAGARGGAGAEAAAPEHPRGSEPRQPASPAPQRERPRRLAHHLPPQCPRPSRGRAWTRLSKCGAPATHDVHGLAPRGGRVAGAAGEKALGARPQRALGFLCLARGSRILSGDSGDTVRGAGRRAAGRGGRPGAAVGPSRLPGTLPKATAGQKVYTGAGRGGGRRRAGAVPRAFRTRFCSFLPSRSFSVPFLFVHLVLERGILQVEASRVPDGPLPGPQVERLPAAPGTGG